MSELQKPECPECAGEFEADVDRRAFLQVVGGTAAALTVGGAAVQAAVAPRPAENLVRELFSTLTDAQKSRVLKPFDYRGRAGAGTPYRLRMYNAPIENITLASVYTRAQQDLVNRIVRSMASGEDGYRQLSRGGTWDASGSFERTGALFFGRPDAAGEPYAFVFAGHHLTIRCDGNSIPNVAFGGPIYYGHSPHGYNRANIFFYQTREVLSVYEALSPAQRRRALINRNPGEQEASVRFRAPGERPGIPCADLTADQRRLVQQVMRAVLTPYRREDADEVMQIVEANGGMNQIKLGFYSANSEEPWDFWRLEGPGFVWNYRVLPHVHCYVNIARLT